MANRGLDVQTHKIAPPPANRPKFWRFYRERELTPALVGEELGRSSEWVRLVSLPFDDPKRRVPDKDDVELIHRWSGGEIGAGDWYPAALTETRPFSVAGGR